MIRALLDTNVLASGIVGFADVRWPPSSLLRLWRERRFQLISSDRIQAELIRSLATPYFRQRLTESQIEAASQLLSEEAIIVPFSVPVTGVASHPEDDLVESAAISGEVDFLGTGDKKLLKLHRHGGIRIVSAREFVELLEEIDPNR
jgi:putative PIN family toxin of toxin-antitoxin system